MEGQKGQGQRPNPVDRRSRRGISCGRKDRRVKVNTHSQDGCRLQRSDPLSPLTCADHRTSTPDFHETKTHHDLLPHHAVQCAKNHLLPVRCCTMALKLATDASGIPGAAPCWNVPGKQHVPEIAPTTLVGGLGNFYSGTAGADSFYHAVRTCLFCTTRR